MHAGRVSRSVSELLESDTPQELQLRKPGDDKLMGLVLVQASAQSLEDRVCKQQSLEAARQAKKATAARRQLRAEQLVVMVIQCEGIYTLKPTADGDALVALESCFVRAVVSSPLSEPEAHETSVVQQGYRSPVFKQQLQFTVDESQAHLQLLATCLLIPVCACSFWWVPTRRAF